MRHDRLLRLLSIALLVLVVYLIAFPLSLGRELVAKPAWIADTSSPASLADGGEGNPYRFVLGDSFGYVDDRGTVRYTAKKLYQVAISDTWFINYPKVGDAWMLQDTRGRVVASIAARGYPLLSSAGDRLFDVKTDLTGIDELSLSGERMWGVDFPSPLTSVSIGDGQLLAGLLDGSLELIDRAGEVVYQYRPGKSRIPVILGCALTADGSMIGAVSGIDPQIVTVLERRDSRYAPIVSRELASDFRREVRIAFSPGSRLLVYEDAGGVTMIDCASLSASTISTSGELESMAMVADSALVVVVSRAERGHELAIAASPFPPAYRERFETSMVFLAARSDGILLSLGTSVARIDVGKM